ncbi:MAG: alcohol dehydrogenase catalytic domain-containing protein [Lentisphaerae bacterium]|nr:alcohol dehydrogenase catalytic domain-containing protein [Lentisphaerota bacterium]
MIALVKHTEGAGNLELREVPEPFPASDEVKIKVKAASICGSDLHIKNWDIGIPMRLPVIPGHEFTGIVTEIGENVKNVSVGDRVTGENTRTSCGVCNQCANGSYNLCKHRLATGYAYDGAFAEYVLIPEKRIHKLPDNVDFISGALTDPSACAFHAVQELTGINAGDIVLITGPGAMGLFSLQYVRSNGGTVVLTGTPKDARRLELARELGADYTITEEETVREIVMRLSNGEGADVVLECSGAEPAADLGLELVRRQGKFTQIGIYGKPVVFDLDRILYKEIKMTGSFSQKYTGWKKALELCSTGKIAVRPLVTHQLPLSDWQKGFSLFENGEAVKVVFDMEI